MIKSFGIFYFNADKMVKEVLFTCYRFCVTETFRLKKKLKKKKFTFSTLYPTWNTGQSMVCFRRKNIKTKDEKRCSRYCFLTENSFCEKAKRWPGALGYEVVAQTTRKNQKKVRRDDKDEGKNTINWIISGWERSFCGQKLSLIENFWWCIGIKSREGSLLGCM